MRNTLPISLIASSPEKVTFSGDEAKQENKDEMTLVVIMREAPKVKP
ncbi:MAG: hypothetical protein GY936_01830 [Ignavibacteriae bacterium]|nr:hypothetical protein [Ignavibacteriota bacterium]